MSSEASELLSTVRKICELLELLAEEKIAERDAKQRASLRAIVGRSATKQKAVLLMNGTRTQKDIHEVTTVNRGHLSVMVGALQKAKLLIGDPKRPNLAISIPLTFFDSDAETK